MTRLSYKPKRLHARSLSNRFKVLAACLSRKEPIFHSQSLIRIKGFFLYRYMVGCQRILSGRIFCFVFFFFPFFSNRRLSRLLVLHLDNHLQGNSLGEVPSPFLTKEKGNPTSGLKIGLHYFDV